MINTAELRIGNYVLFNKKGMRLIIEPDYEKMSKWAANYVAKCINEAKPTAEKPFKLGCPTGSSPLGMYRELIALKQRYSAEEQAEIDAVKAMLGE